MRYIFPSILILISIATFIFYTRPKYAEMQGYQAKVAEYDEALNNEAKLQQDRDALSNAYHSFSPIAEQRLEKLLPDNADNIRLIIDLQKFAVANGVNVVSIEFDSSQTNQGVTGAAEDPRAGSKDYGVFDLSYSITGTYQNFLSFLKALESNLRVSDVQAIDFASGATSDAYTYTLHMKTYWLKAK